jgi:hypothetical protein
MKTKASELRDQLSKAGLPTEQVEEIVKGRVEAGTVEDDVTGAPAFPPVDPTVFDAHLEAIAKAMSGTGGGLVDIDTDPDPGDLGAVVEAMAKGADRIAGTTDSAVKAIGGAVTGLVESQRDLVKSNNVVLQVLGGFMDRLERIEKAVKEPIPPRAQSTTAEPAPHPSEVTTDGGAGAAYQAESDRYDRLLAKAQGELTGQESLAPQRKALIKGAISGLSMPNPDIDGIAKQLGYSEFLTP